MPARMSYSDQEYYLREMFKVPSLRFEITPTGQVSLLDLSGMGLSYLPPTIGKLKSLVVLILHSNLLTNLPPEIGKLTQLQVLRLSKNRLTNLPAEISHLRHLLELRVDYNQLNCLPVEIGNLTSLEVLNLSHNPLSRLPAEIGNLANLMEIDLSENRLVELPKEMGQLRNLRRISVSNNTSLLFPPPEIVARGSTAIITLLREIQSDSRLRFEAKMLLVGEGATGKSSLRRSLYGEPFDPNLSTTHGIEIIQLELADDKYPDIKMTLNTWDFGGQQIYHATHQFFLTRRSLYLVIWNARESAEQCRLNYWLDTIKALAPDAPVLLVATHIDERVPDLNFGLYKAAYPQLVGSFAVSNLNRSGMSELEGQIKKQAAQLPLMGQPWPQSWSLAEQELLSRPEHHLTADAYAVCCSVVGVDADTAKGEFGNYLHDLGKILYFQDDDILSNLVVLKPNWVTKAISRVLTDETTRAAKGILSHADLSRIWSIDDDGQRYERYLFPIFLRLMERFDLSYQINTEAPGDYPTHSLVPQLLPHQPPSPIPSIPEFPTHDKQKLEMIYRLDFVPAGIMSWFIVRTHRYTTELHWRDGVVLKYGPNQASSASR